MGKTEGVWVGGPYYSPTQTPANLPSTLPTHKFTHQLIHPTNQYCLYPDYQICLVCTILIVDMAYLHRNSTTAEEVSRVQYLFSNLQQVGVDARKSIRS